MPWKPPPNAPPWDEPIYPIQGVGPNGSDPPPGHTYCPECASIGILGTSVHTNYVCPTCKGNCFV